MCKSAFKSTRICCACPVRRTTVRPLRTTCSANTKYAHFVRTICSRSTNVCVDNNKWRPIRNFSGVHGPTVKASVVCRKTGSSVRTETFDSNRRSTRRKVRPFRTHCFTCPANRNWNAFRSNVPFVGSRFAPTVDEPFIISCLAKVTVKTNRWHCCSSEPPTIATHCKSNDVHSAPSHSARRGLCPDDVSQVQTRFLLVLHAKFGSKCSHQSQNRIMSITHVLSHN